MDHAVNSSSQRPRILSNIYGGRIGNALAAVAEVIYFVPAGRLLRRERIITYDPAQDYFHQVLAMLPPGWQPDFVLFFLAETQSLPLGIEDSPYLTVCIPGDCLLRLHKLAIDMNFFDVMLPSIAHFEKVFVALGHPQVLYASRGAILGITSAPERWDDPNSVRPHDVVFCGSLGRPYHRQRIKYLERLLRLTDRYKIVTSAGNLSAEEYCNLMRRAKIVIEVPGVESGVNLRTFETVQFGAMLMHEARNRAIEEFYADRKEVVLFDETNFEELLDYYLTHEDERVRIARQAQQRSVNAYTMPALAKQVINRLSAPGFARREKKTVHEISAEEKNNLLACSDYYAKKYQRALQLLGKNILKDGDNWEWLNNLGVVKFTLAQTEGDPMLKRSARRSLHRALKLNPSSWVVRYNLIQLEASDAGLSLPLAAMALQLAEELKSFLATLAEDRSSNLRGLLILDDRISGWQFEMDQYEDIYFAQALEQRPERGLAYAVKIASVLLSHSLKVYARIMSGAGEFTEAAEALFDGLRVHPEHGGLWRLLGEQFSKLEKWPEAAEAFENSLAILPLHVDAELGLVRALINLGEIDLARQRAEDFMRTNIGAPERNDELRALIAQVELRNALTPTLTRF